MNVFKRYPVLASTLTVGAIGFAINLYVRLD